jgi:phosphoribosylformimino-5-aminoimidazole carboxamide ribotide isomerase
MLIIPAIDIKDGCVVRLVQGKLNERVYSRDPLKTARHWARQGAELIHVVDLDGARGGRPKNLSFVKEIINNINVPIEFGGGVRNILTIKKLLAIGISRVVLGTRAAQDKAFIKEAFKRFKEKIIVSLDVHGGMVCVKGWQSNCPGIDMLGFALFLKSVGFRRVIYTDISKDGTLKGPNIQGTKELLKKTGLGVIASGGISSLDDLYKLKSLQKQGLEGVIVGKALYEGKFTLRQASRLA